MNLYVELTEMEGGQFRATLYPTPGFQSFSQTSAVGGRAAFAMDGRCFVVVGSSFIELFTTGLYTIWGAVALDSYPATICSNGDGGGQLLITSGDNAYCFDLTTNTLTLEVTGGATMGGMLYGYGVLFDLVNSTFRISDLFDFTTWDPTQFAGRTIGADPWTSMLVTPYGQICLPGSQTGEFWYNAGGFPFPFAPDPSGLFEEGTAATFSIKQAGKSVVWLSANANGGYAVMRATGFTPQRISDHAFEYQVSQYTRVDDAIGETYEDQGHAFYLLTFPTARVTWGYDFNTNKWHKRGLWIAEDNEYIAQRPTFHCFAFNKHLMADRDSGVIYEMDISFTTDVDERPIRRLRRSPAIGRRVFEIIVTDKINNWRISDAYLRVRKAGEQTNRPRIFFSQFGLILEAGLGTGGTVTGYDPQVSMRYSDDYGQTWNNERQASAGTIGQYGKTVDWSNCGSCLAA